MQRIHLGLKFLVLKCPRPIPKYIPSDVPGNQIRFNKVANCWYQTVPKQHSIEIKIKTISTL